MGMRHPRWWLPVLLATLALPPSLAANVTLPAIFSNHMVLQQNSEVTIWGWAKALEKVTVTASWDGIAVEVTADNRATWQVLLQTPKAGGPYTLTIRGYNAIVIEDVMVGEVWLSSGQSNMEWSARAGIDSAEVEIERATYPEIRFFLVPGRRQHGKSVDLPPALPCPNRVMAP